MWNCHIVLRKISNGNAIFKQNEEKYLEVKDEEYRTIKQQTKITFGNIWETFTISENMCVRKVFKTKVQGKN